MTAKRYRVRLEYPQLARFQQILAQLVAVRRMNRMR